jgi:hypothetical protein
MRSLQTVAGLKVPARLSSFCGSLAIACLAWCGGSQPAWGYQAAVTTLSLISGGNAVSSVVGGTVIALTATVQAGGTTLKLGQVDFCDATSASCTDIHLVGTAQLTSAGTAVLRFRPGPGRHSYKAVFLGTLAGAASSSASVGLTVGPRPPGLQTTFTAASVLLGLTRRICMHSQPTSGPKARFRRRARSLFSISTPQIHCWEQRRWSAEAPAF